MADRLKLGGAVLGLAILATVSLPACAQTPQTPEQATRAYLSSLPSGDGEGNLGGQASTETRVAYDFVCRSQHYGLSLRLAHPGGSLDADAVVLERLSQPGGPVSDEDQRRVQAELDQFRIVHTVSLRCASTGSHAFLISGFGRSEDGESQPSRTRLLWFEGGQLIRVAE